MSEEKLILIGCDDVEYLAIVMNGLKGASYNNNIVTATRLPDLVNISKSLNPDLIIACFRNNQAVLNEFNSFVKKAETPILCLTKKSETDHLHWGKNSIVFTYPLEHAGNAGHLYSRINSILLLGGGSGRNQQETSLAGAAIQQSRSTTGNRNMSRIVLELDQKVDVLMRVKDRITNLFPRVDDPTRVELTYIVNAIKTSVSNSKLWEDFKFYFVKTNPNFLLKLAEKYPDLTQNDLKYCCYLKMNMTNDDIRELLGINQESVRTHKYRLKKKLSLSKDQSLRNYLQSVN